MYIYIYTYIYLNTYMYIYIYVCVYIYTYILVMAGDVRCKLPEATEVMIGAAKRGTIVWCERCLLITNSPDAPCHYRYLILGPLLYPLCGRMIVPGTSMVQVFSIYGSNQVQVFLYTLHRGNSLLSDRCIVHPSVIHCQVIRWQWKKLTYYRPANGQFINNESIN